MKAHTFHADRERVAVGYIRVSTLEQAQEGVSLDAQRDRLKTYCKGIGVKLVEIFADEGISGGTMERPGLQAALRVIQRGRANTLVVVKLDRLTRSVKDLCMLVEEYFAKEQYDLISVCGMVNTHTAAGRLMMLNLANYAQYERELISERVREAMQHMKAQGVRLGVAPYGYRHSHQLDDKGRRIMEPVAAEQEVIGMIAAWHAEGQQLRIIASMLKERGIPSRRGGEWAPSVISLLLEREGHHERKRFKKTPSPTQVCDKGQAAERARQLRGQGLSLREIGRRLRKAGLVPPRGGEWHAASVAELLTYRTEADPVSAAERARELHTAGHSLRQIAVLLTQEGHIPTRGGRWHPASISTLLAVAAKPHQPQAPQ
jgi:DNA invertase Pin-like site-specific DNA recombinase